MVRRIASQVHKQAGRLLRTRFLDREPTWFQAVLNHPPLPLPPKKTPFRSTYDIPSSKLHTRRPRPLPIYYLEDDVRKQFFRDHPFEAFRPVSLVEEGHIDQHPVNDPSWTRLRQKGRNPSPEEYVLLTSFLEYLLTVK
jgi:small subunit ribosomal protein S23